MDVLEHWMVFYIPSTVNVTRMMMEINGLVILYTASVIDCMSKVCVIHTYALSFCAWHVLETQEMQ